PLLSPARGADRVSGLRNGVAKTRHMPRLEADPGELQAARCPHGLPDPRPTTPHLRCDRPSMTLRLRGVCAATGGRVV
ncbi:MAG: hypothetical protein J6D54_13790, partial [Olsenella sp.]|nr:hypothetical protein [Olsenella sp.]